MPTTSTQTTVLIAKVNKMAHGNVRRGLSVSSAILQMPSKPMNAKNARRLACRILVSATFALLKTGKHEYPLSGATGPDFQVQSAAIGMAAGL